MSDKKQTFGEALLKAVHLEKGKNEDSPLPFTILMKGEIVAAFKDKSARDAFFQATELKLINKVAGI